MTLNEARMDILGQERTYPKTNVMATCMVRKHRPQIHSRSASLVEHLRGQLVPVTRMVRLFELIIYLTNFKSQ